MDIIFLKKHIREVLRVLLAEAEQPKFFIRYSPKNGVFILYKRFIGLDQYDNKNEQIVAVQELDSSPKKSEVMAKQLTGQDLSAKKPEKTKPINRGELIMPVSYYKGKKIKEIPLDYLVQFIFNNKWMNVLTKNQYAVDVYDYLTMDLLSQTTEYLKKQIKGTSTPELALKYNEYKKYNYTSGVEKMVFANITIPLMKSELLERMVQFTDDGTVINPK